MAKFEIEVVAIPVPEKTKGKWDEFIETLRGLDSASSQSFFVSVKDNATTLKNLKEQTTKALHAAGIKKESVVVHQEENPLRGGIGLRFWSHMPSKKVGRPRGSTMSEEGKKRVSDAQKARWAKVNGTE